MTFIRNLLSVAKMPYFQSADKFVIRKGRARSKILTIFRPLYSFIWLSRLSVLLISTPQQVFGRLATPNSGSWEPTILEPPIRHPCHKITAEATSTTTIVNFPDLSSLRRSYKTIITVIIIPPGSEPKGEPAQVHLPVCPSERNPHFWGSF